MFLFDLQYKWVKIHRLYYKYKYNIIIFCTQKIFFLFRLIKVSEVQCCLYAIDNHCMDRNNRKIFQMIIFCVLLVNCADM